MEVQLKELVRQHIYLVLAIVYAVLKSLHYKWSVLCVCVCVFFFLSDSHCLLIIC